MSSACVLRLEVVDVNVDVDERCLWEACFELVGVEGAGGYAESEAEVCV